uniref:NADH-ubiquinone oxidoreductase chain 3 n=1 Tax=Tettigarcta crinita TaxID=295286 RepID=A0A3S7MEM2_9HEMI|nr:NADH dehydrogenase subunit 3 [Tettigarcta crinita]
MLKIYMISLTMIFILMMIMMFLYILSTKTFLDREKSSPFECGFDPLSSSRISFSSHFFLIAVIFLIFDVELVIIMPMMLSISFTSNIDMYLVMLIMMMILIMGLYHEWNNGMLNWTQ